MNTCSARAEGKDSTNTSFENIVSYIIEFWGTIKSTKMEYEYFHLNPCQLVNQEKSIGDNVVRCNQVHCTALDMEFVRVKKFLPGVNVSCLL